MGNLMIKRFIIINLFLFDLLLTSPLSGQSTTSAIPIIKDPIGISEEIPAPGNIDTTQNETDTTAALEKDPVLTSFVKASYPDSLLASGIEGSVTMDLLIDNTGHVDSVKLIKGLHPALDSLAMHAASKFVFSPGIAEGKPVSVYLTYEYTFTINETIEKIQEIENFKGIVLEKGTRKPIADAIVSLSIGDTVTKENKDSFKTIITTQGILPLAKYLERIGSFKGQSLDGEKILTVTDSTGKFSFKSIPPGKTYIKVIIGGFDLYNEEIDVHKDEALEIKCYVERVSYNEYEITVYGQQEKKEITRRTLQVTEAKRVPGFSGDAVKAVQALPGVARPIFNSTEVILRGADWEDNKYYIDGIEIPYLWHEIGQNAVLNSNLIENTNLYPGGFGARYGDALGGIIDVESRKAKTDRWHCIADMNLSYSSLELEIPISKKISFIGAMRREYYMSLMGLLLKKTGDLDLSFSAFYWDYSMRLDITPNANHSLFFQYIASKDTMYFKGSTVPGGSDNDLMNFGENFKTGIAGWDWKISKDLKNTLRYGISPIDLQIDMSSNNSNFKGAIHGYEHTVRDELEYKLNDKIIPTLGLDLHLEPSDISYTDSSTYHTTDNYELKDSIERNSIDFTGGSVGGYLSCEVRPVEDLSITPEYRLDYYPGLHFHGSLIPRFWNYKSKEDFRWSCEPSFRLLSRYKISPKHTIKGSLGSYNKSPGYDA
jgi:TonB family protein